MSFRLSPPIVDRPIPVLILAKSKFHGFHALTRMKVSKEIFCVPLLMCDQFERQQRLDCGWTFPSINFGLPRIRSCF